jgi:hypothetical protein
VYEALRLFNLHLRSALLQFSTLFLLVNKLKNSYCSNRSREKSKTTSPRLVNHILEVKGTKLAHISGDTVPLSQVLAPPVGIFYKPFLDLPVFCEPAKVTLPFLFGAECDV